MLDQKVVLITGASSGVGQSTARLLSQRGYKVFGTSRNPAIANTIPSVEMLPLDVRADDSVRACVEAVSTRGGRIDVPINNAGHEMAGALEELTPEESRLQFETNFFGVVRMVNAVLPLMRRQRRGSIINVSSLSGLSPIPFLGIYSASKFALEGYSEALRHEVKPFNIQVSMAEPSFLKTPMMNNRQVAANRIAEYDPWRLRALTAIRTIEEKSPGPELVAETVLEIVCSTAPRLRYLIGQQAKSVARLRRFLPAGLFEQGVRRTSRWTRVNETLGPNGAPRVRDLFAVILSCGCVTRSRCSPTAASPRLGRRRGPISVVAPGRSRSRLPTCSPQAAPSTRSTAMGRPSGGSRRRTRGSGSRHTAAISRAGCGRSPISMACSWPTRSTMSTTRRHSSAPANRG